MNFEALTPILNVSDIKATFTWFELLGWKIGFEWGNPVGFGSVCSGECEIFLCQDGQGGRGKGTQSQTFSNTETGSADQGVWLSVWVDDVDEVHQHCIHSGIEITLPPTNMPWNVREMHIRHPDGHVFRIGKGIQDIS